MTDQATAWTCTGVSWRGGRPSIVVIDGDGRESARPLMLGERFGVRIAGGRVCIGLRRGTAGGRVRGCPFQARLPGSGAGAQCDACANADPGRMLARDATVDPRPFRLYLA